MGALASMSATLDGWEPRERVVASRMEFAVLLRMLLLSASAVPQSLGLLET